MPTNNQTRGPSIQMPTVKLSLGKFVVALAPRADGTRRVLFQVPPRLRPSGWSPTIPLPRTGERTGDLTNAAEVARIQADAKALYAELEAARRGEPVKQGRTFETLAASWRRTDEYRDLKPRTQTGYEENVRRIEAWSEACGHPDPARLTQQGVRAFFAEFDDRPWVKWHVRKVLRILMNHAVAVGWRADNPVEGIRVKMPKSTVAIWEPEDVEAYAWAAIGAGQPDLAGVIMMEWEIGQRLTDAILFRRGAEYEAAEGVFRFWQSKTNSYVTIPVSDRLRAILAHLKRDGSPYLFHDGGTGRPFRDVNRLGHVFEEVRDRLVLPSLPDTRTSEEQEDHPVHERHRVLRALRHSCVVQLARYGCTVPEIASITGHSIQTVESILSTYLPRDNVVAWNAQRKRGLIKESA